MDIDDIKSRFPGKYDQHIEDMVNSLQHNKRVAEDAREPRGVVDRHSCSVEIGRAEQTELVNGEGPRMDIEITPHVGAGPFQLGMSFDDAMETARERGATVKHSPEGGRPPGKYVVKHSDVTLNFVLIFDAREQLDSVELWRFVNEDEDVNVSLDGLDVFRTPKKKLRREIERRGHTIDYNDAGFDGIADYNVILANASSQELPADPRTGFALYFDYLLVARKIAP
ncbi:hypothetical protein [Streptomyces sp. NPDC088725]|uniref:hypothetical protein n=1 Tax=Streptomyces sp. NPDC088725 TaxID=3365873 RepID=UPI0037FE961F